MSYIGNPIVSTDFPKDTFSGNGSTTAFTMSIAPASVNAVIVAVSGVVQDPSTYTISGTTLTFSGAPPSGTSNISVRHLGVAGTPQVPAVGSVTSASIAAQDLAINGVTVGKGANSVTGNTVLGANALSSGSQSGTYGVAIGTNALAANTSGGNNVGVGTNALTSNTTGANNIAIGRDAAQTNSTGGSNVAIGGSALQSNTTASNNTAVGYQAGYSNTTSPNLTAVGYQALYAANGYNTAFGNVAAKNTTGFDNVAIGDRALTTNTTGGNNVAVGLQALQASTTASNNTAVGFQAGYANTTGVQNTYIGYGAGLANTTASYNLFLGYLAGASFNTSGNGLNTFVGGNYSGGAVTTGTNNTIIGNYSGNQGGLNITTASNKIVLSDGAGNPRAYHDGATWFWCTSDANGYKLEFDGAEFYPRPDNGIKLGYPSLRWTTVYAVTGTINTSDATQKQQIRSLDEAEKAVAKAIKGLIKAFKFNDSVVDKGDNARIHVGVIAQEVQSAFIAEGLDPNKYAMFCSDTWYEVDGQPKNDDGFYTEDTPNAVEVTRLGIRYEELLAFVISAL